MEVLIKNKKVMVIILSFKRRYSKWTDDEIKLLIENHNKISRNELYKLFSNHSNASTKRKINELGLAGKIAYGENEYVINGETTTLILRNLDWCPIKCLIDTEDLERVLKAGRWGVSKKRKDGNTYVMSESGNKQFYHALSKRNGC